MPFLSSVRWRGVELNDGVNYLLDTRESTLDDPNPAEATYATRKDATPVLMGATLRETTIVLNINIKAASSADLDAKIQQLRRIFNPAELKEYKLERRLPHEQYHKYIMAAARTINFNRAMRKCSVTLQAADMTWQDSAEQTQTTLLFDGTFSENLVVNYTGNLPVEPILEVKAKSPGSDGPTPLYYRDIALWYWAPERLVNFPVKLIENWNVNSLISGGKMRSDYSDVSLTLAGRTVPHNIVERSSGVIDVWALPSFANTIVVCTLSPSTRGAVYDVQLPSSWGVNSKIKFNVNRGSLPATATVKIGNEFITYTSPVQTAQGSPVYEVTITARGVYGSPVEDHYAWSPVMFADTARVSYGYALGYERLYPRQWGGPWPDIDYVNSTNGEWRYTTNRTRQFFEVNGTPLTGLNWYAAPVVNPRARETLEMISLSDPTYRNFSGLVSTYPAPFSGVGNVQRLVLEQPGGQSLRRISWLRIVFELTGGPNPAAPGFTVILNKVRFGSFGSVDLGKPNEFKNELWRYTHNSTGTVTVDTGYICTNNWNATPSHFVIEIPDAPVDSSNRLLLRIKEFYIRWDGFGATEYYDNLHWPHAGGLGTERGIGTGEFPVYLNVRNLSDSDQTSPFTIAARMADETVGIIDCQGHTVSGALTLEEVSYKKSNWLRLLPGNNTIQFSAGVGTGQVEIKLRWRNRY